MVLLPLIVSRGLFGAIKKKLAFGISSGDFEHPLSYIRVCIINVFLNPKNKNVMNKYKTL